MILQKLNFNAHIIWAREDGFHVFGYSGATGGWMHRNDEGIVPEHREYRYKHPKHKDSVSFFRATRPLCHFNGYMPLGDSSVLFGQRTYAILTDQLAFFNGANKLDRCTQMAERLSGYPKNKVYGIPPTANFDLNDKKLVFAWGKSLWVNGELTKTEKPCCDARISPDGETLAIIVGTVIRFIDLGTNLVRYELDTGYKLHYLSYALDGLTIGAITKCRKMVIFDVE
jgi:hypothetical protein